MLVISYAVPLGHFIRAAEAVGDGDAIDSFEIDFLIEALEGDTQYGLSAGVDVEMKSLAANRVTFPDSAMGSICLPCSNGVVLYLMVYNSDRILNGHHCLLSE